MDGHGDIRIVETKLSTNDDERLILQGLEYYVWARAYRDLLCQRLGAPKRAEFEIHYVIGDDAEGKIRTSHHTKPQVAGLHPDIRWRFQTVRDWFHAPGEESGLPTVELSPRDVVPPTR